MEPMEATGREIDDALSAAIGRARPFLDPWMVAGVAATLVAGYAMAELDRVGRAATPGAILERARLVLADWSAGARAAA